MDTEKTNWYLPDRKGIKGVRGLGGKSEWIKEYKLPIIKIVKGMKNTA